MPQVPYTPYPTVQPTERGTPALRVATPGAAFGETVAQAVEHLGGIEEHAGDELWNRAIALKDVENRAEADKLVADYMEKSGKLHADFSAKQGFDASNSLDGHIAALKSTRDQMEGDASNPQVQRLFNSESRSVLGRNIFNAAGHAAQQQKIGVNAAADARIDAAKEYSFQNPQDQGAFDQSLRDAEAITRSTKAGVHGWDSAKTDEEVGKVKSSMVMHRILGLAKTQPFDANDLLKANNGLMRADDYLHAQSAVVTALRTSGARVLGDEYNPVVPEGEEPTPVKERVEKAVEAWDKMAPNDPAGRTFVEHQVRTIDAERKRDRIEFEKANIDTVSNAVISPINGQYPTRIDQLKATDPKTSMAVDNILKNKVGREKLLKQLELNARGNFRMQQDGIDHLSVLKGKLLDGEAISPMDVWGDPLINNQAKREIDTLRKRVAGPAAQQPHVQRALRDIGLAKLDDWGFVKGTDKYNKFLDSLNDGIESFIADKKRPPNPEETREMGRQLMGEHIEPGLFGWTYGPFGTKRTNIEPDLPTEKIEAIKQSILRRHPGINPDSITNEEVRRNAVLDALEESFKAKSLMPPLGTK